MFNTQAQEDREFYDSHFMDALLAYGEVAGWGWGQGWDDLKVSTNEPINE